MPAAKVQEIRLDMERAEAQRLQPHHIQSFFIDAFKRLGGQIKQREEGRFEVSHVPISIRERDRQIGTASPVQKKYERICFEKSKVNQQPVATFVCPGHPLLEAVISLVREQYDHLMKQGAVLVDETDDNTGLTAIFLLEHSVQDGRPTSTGKPHIISERLQFASVDKAGKATNAGIAPHLNLRPATQDELAVASDKLHEDWLKQDLEKAAVRFATMELAQGHVSEVKNRRLPEIAKVEQEVKARLLKEINFWDNRAAELREDELAGKKTRLNWQNASRRAEDLADRMKRRMELLKKEKFITAQPPRVRGGMLVIPKGLLDARAQTNPRVGHFAEDPEARRAVELKAMEAVMAAERALGNQPKDVSAQKVGYDIASYSPSTQHLRFIEVKGRVDGADTVTLTRQEIITSLHEPEKFILAIVQIETGFAREPRYVRGALQDHEPSFEHTAVQFDLRKLLERAKPPQTA